MSYFEKEYWHIKREDSNVYKSLLTLADISGLLASQTLTFPSCRVVDNKTNEYPDSQLYTYEGSNNIDPLRYSDFLAKGGTLAMAGLHNHLFSLREFVSSLERRTGFPCQTNIYLTPKDSQGFAPHYDTHDVIILQIHGSKIWRIYESDVILPDKSMDFEKDVYKVGALQSEFLLTEGDLLYIPRGKVHDAFTRESDSLHITVGILGYTLSQIFIETVLRLTSEKVDFRKFMSNSLPISDYNKKVEELLDDIRNDLRSMKGVRHFKKQLFSRHYFTNKNYLICLLEFEQKVKDSTFTLLQYPISITEDSDNVFLEFINKKLAFPIYCRRVIDRLFFEIQSNHSLNYFNLTDILDEESLIVLLKRLFREGIISVND